MTNASSPRPRRSLSLPGFMERYSSSVRPTATLLAVGLIIVTTALQIPVPEWVQRICELVIGFYFMSRAQEKAARQAKEG